LTEEKRMISQHTSGWFMSGAQKRNQELIITLKKFGSFSTLVIGQMIWSKSGRIVLTFLF